MYLPLCLMACGSDLFRENVMTNMMAMSDEHINHAWLVLISPVFRASCSIAAFLTVRQTTFKGTEWFVIRRLVFRFPEEKVDSNATVRCFLRIHQQQYILSHRFRFHWHRSLNAYSKSFVTLQKMDKYWLAVPIICWMPVLFLQKLVVKMFFPVYACRTYA